MTNILRIHRICTLALVVGMIPASAGAQQAAAPAGQQPGPVVAPYTVGQARPELVPGSEMLTLTLEQAMDMALEKNLDLKAARLNPISVDYQLRSARAAFLPRYSSTYRYNNATTPSNNTIQGVANVTNQGQNFNATYAQALPWLGGSFTTNFTNSRQATNDRSSRFNPQLASGLSFQYTQPLLAGLRIDSNRNQLRTLAIQRQITDIQLLTTIENTKASVRTAYWNLRAAIEQIEIQRRSLELAQRLYQDNLTKVEIGTLAQIETTTSETQVANAEQALLNAQIQWRTAELNLKRLLAAGPDDEVYRATINPIETAALSLQAVDIAGAVDRALADRTDLAQSRRQVESSRLSLELAADATKPQLDLVTGYNTNGQGGTRFTDGQVVEETGYGGALRKLASFDTSGWNAQFNFTLPFGRDITVNRIARARAQLQIDQALAQIQAQELTVSAQVTNAGLAVENTYKQYQAAQKARDVAERNAEAEQIRFEVGMSTNYNVVQAQTNLTTQRLAELRAVIGYLNAVAEFERVQRVGGGGGGVN